ncbi:hypothetical protein EV128_104103 [Rhizobium azibense]|nr:hypothetical protein EV128_104103 [Rhizobium azibense]
MCRVHGPFLAIEPIDAVETFRSQAESQAACCTRAPVLGSDGEPVQQVRFRRDTLLQFFERAAPAIVGMESCAGSQWIARKIQALGHKVRLIPAQFVKPYVKSNKSDIIDAEAIAEAPHGRQ